MKTLNTKRKSTRSVFYGVLFVLGVTMLITCGPPDNTRGNQAQRGQAHYKEYCASCHGNDGKGVVVDSLAIQPADLTRITVKRRLNSFPVMEVAKIIDGRIHLKSHGPRPMPIWGDVFSKEQAMTEDEIKGELGELVAFLMKIQRTR